MIAKEGGRGEMLGGSTGGSLWAAIWKSDRSGGVNIG